MDFRPRVLVVDDEADVASTIARGLREVVASHVTIASSASEALERLAVEPVDVVISDVHMPGMTGLELVAAVQARDLDVPVILVTGDPTVQTAAKALEVGAYRYLSKPVEIPILRTYVEQAASVRGLARTKGGDVTTSGRAALEAAFRRALASMRMVYQPIVNAETRITAGYEALLRCSEPALPSPPAVIGAAEKLGALHVLGRRVRNLVGSELDRTPIAGDLYVNLHPADLADGDLFDRSSPLSRHAHRVVLELTERATLESVPELSDRLDRLRKLGYRIAVDDLGAGYAGLSYFANVKPEIVKIDMSLVRGVDTDTIRQRVVSSLTGLARSLGMEIIGEGVETTSERDAIIRLGCTYVQGYLLAKPGPPFPGIRWE